MKKATFLLMILLASAVMKAQDSTVLTNVKLTAKVTWYSFAFLLESKDADDFDQIIVWKNLQNTTTGMNDTITANVKTTVLAKMYRNAHEISTAIGSQYATILKNEVAYLRNNNTPANTYFKRLCDQVDAQVTESQQSLFFYGRRRMRGN